MRKKKIRTRAGICLLFLSVAAAYMYHQHRKIPEQQLATKVADPELAAKLELLRYRQARDYCRAHFLRKAPKDACLLKAQQSYPAGHLLYKREQVVAESASRGHPIEPTTEKTK
ncbi:hypothetical protein [Xanthomonas translucens]|uniref:hypothetical protein n=1 Tax=Xanthomonas campestris pv. translucens TaxID=343 RepID=UPI000AD2A193|nr:hypothetical protein [Xanthomonas translucens]